MTSLSRCLLLISLPLAAASAQSRPDFKPYAMADRAAEVALARSAAIASISDSATVLVLTPTGYSEAAHGSNGFTCLVARGFEASVNDPDFRSTTIRAPHCLNPPASRTMLPEMTRRAEWYLSGVAPAEIASRTSKAYASHELPLPAAGAMAYMTSPKQHLSDKAPQNWKPHLMLYVDRSLPASTWGAGGFDATIIDATAGDPSSPVQVLLIPVARWSDGTPVTTGGEHQH